MKVRVTYADYAYQELYQYDYQSIKQAAAHCGRGPRIISKLLKTGGEANSKLGKIVHVEGIDGKAEGVGGQVREYPHLVEENSALGSLALRGGGGWVQQALGKVTSAVKRIFSQFG